MAFLALAFVVTAILYASVGFAGGSTYNALLALAGVDHRVFPIVALACNLIVATGGTIRFARARLVPWRRLAPLLALSVPAAWIGGMLPVSKHLFLALLGGSLLVAGILLLVQPEREMEPRRAALVGPAVAAPIGLLSGIVGIGGGIFLAPVLHLVGWDRARRVAATASIFILANSIAGLGGQLTKLAGHPELIEAAFGYWPLALAVLVGGQIGSRAGVQLLPPTWLRRLTALLILYVSVRILLQVWGG
ncbi:TSUP family transporter [Sphingomonas sp. MAH-20]|uniref:Probable membrane transporter protein n=1 Tax=Sphingomonas horti TaxID=2682842 RepID=A0A6I4J1H6_9SPHN|nr:MULTISPECIES: sulfite exporter TauE/SafE family protein [Sphingomonas]MBA2919579.1 sulfite exporter TauE/SafE family protein [Sphingomonas sp. CGMCC 1.13658]MVO78459.1 TSUP family transporter [Sphingomonas horti]